MRKLFTIACLAVTLAGQTASAQTHETFKHIDVAFTAGTTGLGFDLATPLASWARLRMGASFRMQSHYYASLDTEIGVGQSAETQTANFNEVAKLMTSFVGDSPKRSIDMDGTFRMNNFKLLVDFYPIRSHRNFRVTAGFYYGNSLLVEGMNTIESGNTLAAITTYNHMYDLACKGEVVDMSRIGMSISGAMKDKMIEYLTDWGEITIPMGTLTRDIKDADGNVVYKTGETLRLTPDQDDMIRINAKVKKFKPYVGVGYELPVTKDGRTLVGVDAGVLFWGGKPSVEASVAVGEDESGNKVYQTVDLTRDVENLPGRMADHIATAKRYSVFPVVGLRISQRIW